MQVRACEAEKLSPSGAKPSSRRLAVVPLASLRKNLPVPQFPFIYSIRLLTRPFQVPGMCALHTLHTFGYAAETCLWHASDGTIQIFVANLCGFRMHLI